MVSRENPYPGPRPFRNTPDDIRRFFGRRREQRDIQSLVIAQRNVLLYGKSGTGKTSLLNAGLIPALQQRGLQVLSVARVQGVIPEANKLPNGTNIYIQNVLSGWKENTEHKTLVDYLAEMEHHTDADGYRLRRVVIFDQFEELFTNYPLYWKHRLGFFEQVRAALEADDALRILFIMREDYIAELDNQYADLMPNRMSVRFRLERLGRDQALQAIIQPLNNTGRQFVNQAEEALVDKLLAVQPTGEVISSEAGLEQFVEPVVLQVVCQNLWDELENAGLGNIGLDEVETYAQVNDALLRFYDDCIRETVEATGVNEQRIRDWFEEHLITPAGTRKFIHWSEIIQSGITEMVARKLQDRHIIRGERRENDLWLELVHDRFIEPIRESNKLFLERSLKKNIEQVSVVRLQSEQIQQRYEDQLSLESRLWEAADVLRANSRLRASEYSTPVLGLIFLRFADHKFARVEREVKAQKGKRRTIDKSEYLSIPGVVYVSEDARYQRLLELPEGENIGRAVNRAMEVIAEDNEKLREALPRTYNRFDNDTLVELLKIFNRIPPDIEGDAFGRIYEYFLGNFARSEGQKGGEFFTPISLVKLIVEIIEPFGGRIFDPACGSGGMFVQSARFVEEHQGNPTDRISIFGQDRVNETIRLAQMNLAVHGLEGEIRSRNSYYQKHPLHGHFDYVMANPPFNVDKIDKDKLKDDTTRFPFGMPAVNNGNYIWIQLFYSALNEHGRAGFVMPNSAADARASEAQIRQKLIETGTVDVMVTTSPNLFYTVPLSSTLWFLDKAKPYTAQRNTVLFIDARDIFVQVDRSHRAYTPSQIEFVSNIVRLYRGEMPETTDGSSEMMSRFFPNGTYENIPGRCHVATLDEIKSQGWSLNPGRYVGVAPRPVEEFVFRERLEELREQLTLLNAEAHELETKIDLNLQQLLGLD